MAFAKLITYELLEKLHAEHGPVAPRCYVDDMAMMAIELSQAALYRALAPASVAFVTELAQLGLRVSAQSQMGPAGSSALRQLQRLLGRRGVAVALADEGRDLGVDAAAGRLRSRRVAARRISAARQRGWRVAHLFGRGARSLALTTTRVATPSPQAVWGAASGGTFPTDIERIRRLVATSAGANGAGRCLTTSLAVLLPPGKDPGIALRLAILGGWRSAWATLGEQ